MPKLGKNDKPKLGRPTNESKLPKAKEGEKIICQCCGSKDQANFYKSQNRFNRYFGYVPYCKDCMKGEMWEYFFKKYNGNEQLALHGLLRSLNLPYIHSVYLGSLQNLSNPNAKINNVKNDNSVIDGVLTPDNNSVLVSAYMKQYNSFHDRNGYGDTYLECDGVSEIQGLSSFEDVIKINRKKKTVDIKNVNTDKYEVLEYDADELVSKWGNFDDCDLIYLENEYLDWKDKIGDFIGEKSTDIMVKQVCLETLNIYKKRESGDSTNGEIKTLQALLSNSGLLEKQSINANTKKSLGVRIADLEEYAPIKPVDCAVDDVDGYREMILSMAGCVCKALNVQNEYTKVADKILAPYNLDVVEQLSWKPDEDNES